MQGLVSRFGRMEWGLRPPGVRTVPSGPDSSRSQTLPQPPPSGHDTLAEGETSLVWGPGCLCPLDLFTLHLGSLEGTSPYAPPRPGQRGQDREAPVDTLPGPSLPTRNCTSARRRWLVLACLLFFKQEMPGCSSQGLCSEPDSAGGSVCSEQVGAGRLGGLPGTFPRSCLNLCSSSPK